MQNNIIRVPAKFWQYVSEKRKDRQPIREYQSGDRSVSGQEAADAFAEFFSSVFHSRVPNLNPDLAQASVSGDMASDAFLVNIDHFTMSELRRSIKKLKPRSSSGPDAIPAFIVKDCKAALEDPLLYLYNLSLKQCRYPARWKISKVTPVPKGSPSIGIEMHRPIAVPSVFGKVFESMVDSEIRHRVGPRFSNCQHGFRAARSISTNLINLTDYVSRRMDVRLQVDAAYFDFKKAFDLVDNDILLIKLAAIGFAPSLIRFFANYLSNRSQFVSLENYVSKVYFTRSGVSQGSTLGPTLFLIMINDLPSVISSSECLMFADDLKLFSAVGSDADCEALQRDINQVAEWSADNCLPFNVSKCKTITFSRLRSPLIHTYHLNGSPFERVDTIRDLGLMMDTRLDFNSHISAVCKQACKTLGFIMRVTWEFPDARAALMLYKAYVRSRLEFGAVVWDPHEDKYRLMLEKVQRKFSRYLYKRIYGYYPYLYPSLFVSGMVGLDTLQLRRKLLLLTHYYMLLRGEVDNPSTLQQMGFLVPRRYMTGAQGAVGSRRRQPLFAKPPGIRTCAGAAAPTPRALSLLNELVAQNDADVFVDNASTFFRQLFIFLNL